MPDVGSLPAWLSAVVAVVTLVVTVVAQTSKGESKARPKGLSVLLEEAEGVQGRLGKGTELERELNRALLRSITSRAAALAYPLTPTWIPGFGLALFLTLATLSKLIDSRAQVTMELAFIGFYVVLCGVVVLWILGKRRKYVQLHLPLAAFETPVSKAIMRKARENRRTKLKNDLTNWEEKEKKEEKKRLTTATAPAPTSAKDQTPHQAGSPSQRPSGRREGGTSDA